MSSSVSSPHWREFGAALAGPVFRFLCRISVLSVVSSLAIAKWICPCSLSSLHCNLNIWNSRRGRCHFPNYVSSSGPPGCIVALATTIDCPRKSLTQHSCNRATTSSPFIGSKHGWAAICTRCGSTVHKTQSVAYIETRLLMFIVTCCVMSFNGAVQTFEAFHVTPMPHMKIFCSTRGEIGIHCDVQLDWHLYGSETHNVQLEFVEPMLRHFL